MNQETYFNTNSSEHSGTTLNNNVRVYVVGSILPQLVKHGLDKEFVWIKEPGGNTTGNRVQTGFLNLRKAQELYDRLKGLEVSAFKNW